MRTRKPLSDVDRAVIRHHEDGLSYEAIAIATGLDRQDVRSIVKRLTWHGLLKQRPRGAAGHGRTLSAAEAVQRRSEAMRAHPNNRPTNQVIENGWAGQDLKRPRMSWDQIDALYGWVTVFGERKPGVGAKVYEDVRFRQQ